MSKMRHMAAAIAVTVALGAGGSPSALASGIPVIDVASIAEAIRQYEQMVAQLEQLQGQLRQAKQQYESMTGTRGMERMLRGEANEVIPTSWQETLQQMNGGQINDLANSIKQAASKLDQATMDRLLPSSTAQASQSFANSAASAQASAGQAYELSTQRFQRLQQLMDSIPQATDPKAIADLQARIGIEQTVLQNEAIKMMALAQSAQSQQYIQQQQIREMSMDRPSSNNSLPDIIRR